MVFGFKYRTIEWDGRPLHVLSKPSWSREETLAFALKMDSKDFQSNREDLYEFRQAGHYYGFYEDDPGISEDEFLVMRSNLGDDGLSIISGPYSDEREQFERAYRFYDAERFHIISALIKRIRVDALEASAAEILEMSDSDVASRFQKMQRVEKICVLSLKDLQAQVLREAILDNEDAAIAFAAVIHENTPVYLIEAAATLSPHEIVRRIALRILRSKVDLVSFN